MNGDFEGNVAEGTSKDGAVAGMRTRCWHEREVTQLFTDLAANWAAWARPL